MAGFALEGRASCCRRSTRLGRVGRHKSRMVQRGARTYSSLNSWSRQRRSRAAARASCSGTSGIAPSRCHRPALRRNDHPLCRCIRKSASLAPCSRHESASLFKIRVWATRKSYLSRRPLRRAASCAADTYRHSPDFSFFVRSSCPRPTSASSKSRRV